MQEIDVERLQAVVDEGGQVVDVREPAEFAQAHVPGARLVPMGQVMGRLEELDQQQPLYLICAVGSRSAHVGQVLEGHGYDVVNVAGGTLAWVRAGKPFDQGL